MGEKYKNMVIFGSPNANSFTAELMLCEKNSLSGKTFFYDCFKQNPFPCRGCGVCKNTEICTYNDLSDFFKAFEESENIIIAFPIYNSGFPAPLKALIDRFQPYYNARFVRNKKPPLKGKRNVTLIITSGSDKDYIDIILAQLRPLFSITGCTLKKTVILKGTDTKPFCRGDLTGEVYDYR